MEYEIVYDPPSVQQILPLNEPYPKPSGLQVHIPLRTQSQLPPGAIFGPLKIVAPEPQHHVSEQPRKRVREE